MSSEPLRPQRNAPDVEAAYETAPPELVAEILDGELVLLPRPKPRHSRAAGRLLRALGPYDDDPGDPGGWVILFEPELHLGKRPDKLGPDLAGWRRERFPPDVLAARVDADVDEEPAAITVAPDWVCEVLSASTERHDRTTKRRIYRRERVAHYWLLDPRARTLDVLRLVDGRWLEVETYEGDARVRAEPFDAIELDLAPLWAW